MLIVKLEDSSPRILFSAWTVISIEDATPAMQSE